MRIAATGFVAMEAGSVASANAILLRGVLSRGTAVDFFSKPSFVDPRPMVAGYRGFRFIDCTNQWADRVRRCAEPVPGLELVAGRLDAVTYNRLLVRRMGEMHREHRYDLVLWMGDYARGRVPGVPSVSFVQGPPGTDARSILDRSVEIRRLAGVAVWLKWRILASIRLSQLGLPRLYFSDHLIVGSLQSKGVLHGRYGVPEKRISTMPYPIDLNHFRPLSSPELQLPSSELRDANSGGIRVDKQVSSLRVLWLGRIIPRKRLDLFLDGAALAIQRGLDITVTIVGGIGFIPGYEKLISAFPNPRRLAWHQSVPRTKVPELMRSHDVLVQPSDEENFGSSVAEAQACGMPVIVGRTNGNADYLSSRDIQLTDDKAETLVNAFAEMASRKKQNFLLGDSAESCANAKKLFDIDSVTNRLLTILDAVKRT